MRREAARHTAPSVAMGGAAIFECHVLFMVAYRRLFCSVFGERERKKILDVSGFVNARPKGRAEPRRGSSEWFTKTVTAVHWKSFRTPNFLLQKLLTVPLL